MPIRIVIPTLLAAVGLVWLAASPHAQSRYDRDYPIMRYARRVPSDRVTGLQRRVADGETMLDFEVDGGYLASLLDALEIPTSSQMLVFSGTSLQADLVSSHSPRAIYFGDDVYVAWLRGSDLLEIAALDPDLGPVFYTLRQEPRAGPRFERQTALCLECHDTYGLTGGGVPRFLIGSGPTDVEGRSASHEGWRLTTDRTPLARRWGGWYVTGTHGEQRHAGNIVITSSGEPMAADDAAPGNRADLSGLLDTSSYLTGLSDIVALMVVEHQIAVQNVLTRVHWEVRQRLAEPAGPAADLETEIAELTEPLVAAMLLVNAAEITAPIAGTSGFQADFESLGPWDAQGRSLRQLELTHRLFEYPMSYVVYSAAFDGLPAVARDQLFHRLRQVLAGEDPSPMFDHLTESDRRAILEILRETKPAFARWLATRDAAP